MEAADNRRAAAEALFDAMDAGHFDLDLAAIDRLNEAPPVDVRRGSGTAAGRYSFTSSASAGASASSHTGSQTRGDETR
jgi:hypothetical protein